MHEREYYTINASNNKELSVLQPQNMTRQNKQNKWNKTKKTTKQKQKQNISKGAKRKGPMAQKWSDANHNHLQGSYMHGMTMDGTQQVQDSEKPNPRQRMKVNKCETPLFTVLDHQQVAQ